MNESLTLLLVPKLFDGYQSFKDSGDSLSTKGRSMGYVWELYQYLYRGSFDYIVSRNDKIKQCELQELRAPKTSQWKLDVLYGRKLANETTMKTLVGLHIREKE